MRVTGLITQGAKRIGSPEYVKSYKVAYSDDGKTWRTYKVKGKEEDMVRHIDTYTVTHCILHRKGHRLVHMHSQRLDSALIQGQGRGHDEMAF